MDYNTRDVVSTLTLTIGATNYDCISCPSGLSKACDLPDVTTLTDEYTAHAPAACVNNEPLTFSVLGAMPSVGEVAGASISGTLNNTSGAAVSYTVDLGQVIVTDVKSATVEAGGNRVMSYDVTLQPTGFSA